MFGGQLKWVKFGHDESKFNSKGVLKEEKKLQKTTEDFKGKRSGEAGELNVCGKQYDHPSNLSLNDEYAVVYEVKNAKGEVVVDSMSKILEADPKNASSIEFRDSKYIPIADFETDFMLHMTFQTKNHGITKGKPIAKGSINLQDLRNST
jgi:hypothetical protein